MDEILTDIFDEKQRTALLALVEKTKEDAVSDFRKQLEEEGVALDEFLGLTKADRRIHADRVQVTRMKEIWENHGVSPTSGKKFTVDKMVEYSREYARDTQFSADQPILIQQVVDNFVREAVEPNLVLTNLLVPVQYQHGTRIQFPATSAFYAQEIAESTEYPEMELQWAGVIEATAGKVGLAVKFSEDMLKYSMFDIMAYHLREAGKALARYKEGQVAALLDVIATTDFDNDGGTPTSGRDFAGALNGTFTLDDLLVMYAAAVNAGWTPNALIVNPMAWLVFARDPTMQALAFAQGNQPYFRAPAGMPGSNPAWKGKSLTRPSAVSDPSQIATTYANVPNIFPVPLRIIVSPFVNYDAANQTTDIFLCDTSELGYLVVEEGVVSESWRQPERELQKTKFREKYSVVSAIEPHVRAARNVSIAKGFDWQNRAQWIAGTGELSMN